METNTKAMPFVAVIGGLWQLDAGVAASAKVTGREIGTELAKAGFGLVVYFSNPESLEPHVVSGYTTALAEGNGSIRVRYANSQRGQIKFAEETDHQDLFDHRVFPGEDWEVPFYRSLAEKDGVDAVLLLGGAISTLIAGQIAVARRLPILAVNTFDGSAATIWKQLAQASPDNNNYPSWGTRSVGKFVEQLKKECAAATALRADASRREQALTEIIAQRKKVTHAAGSFILLLASLFFGIVYTPVPAGYPFLMFIGLIAAGATGALVRAVLSGPAESDPRTSLLLGSIAGFVVGLAYLIPQWVGAPGVLTPRVEMILPTDKIQFVSAILVAISAGVGFDTVFTRLQKQAQDAAVGPPR